MATPQDVIAAIEQAKQEGRTDVVAKLENGKIVFYKPTGRTAVLKETMVTLPSGETITEREYLNRLSSTGGSSRGGTTGGGPSTPPVSSSKTLTETESIQGTGTTSTTQPEDAHSEQIRHGQILALRERQKKIDEQKEKAEQLQNIASQRKEEVQATEGDYWIMGEEGQEQTMSKAAVIEYYEGKETEYKTIVEELEDYNKDIQDILDSEKNVPTYSAAPPIKEGPYSIISALDPQTIGGMDIDPKTKEIISGIGGVVSGFVSIPVGIGEYIVEKFKHPETLGEVPSDLVFGPIEWAYSLTKPDRPLSVKVGETLGFASMLRGSGGTKGKVIEGVKIVEPKILDIVIQRGRGYVDVATGDAFKVTSTVLRAEVKVLTDISTLHYLSELKTRGLEVGKMSTEVGGISLAEIKTYTPKTVLGQKGLSEFLTILDTPKQTIVFGKETFIPLSKTIFKGETSFSVLKADLGSTQGITLSALKQVKEGQIDAWVKDFSLRKEATLGRYVKQDTLKVPISKSFGVEQTFIDALGKDSFVIQANQLLFKGEKIDLALSKYDIKVFTRSLPTYNKPPSVPLKPLGTSFSQELLTLGKAATSDIGLKTSLIRQNAPLIDLVAFEKLTKTVITKDVEKMRVPVTTETIQKGQPPKFSPPVLPTNFNTFPSLFPSQFPKFPSGTDSWSKLPGKFDTLPGSKAVLLPKEVGKSGSVGKIDTGVGVGNIGRFDTNIRVGQTVKTELKQAQQERSSMRLATVQMPKLSMRPTTVKDIRFRVPETPTRIRVVPIRKDSDEEYERKGRRFLPGRTSFGKMPRYIPSLTAQALKIQSFKPPKALFSGLEIRPIIKKKK